MQFEYIIVMVVRICFCLCAQRVQSKHVYKNGSFSDWSPLPIQCRCKMCKCAVFGCNICGKCDVQSSLSAGENNHHNRRWQGDLIPICIRIRIKWNGTELKCIFIHSETFPFIWKKAAADDNDDDGMVQILIAIVQHIFFRLPQIMYAHKHHST